MNKPHKHAELIKAWADGTEIEFFSPHAKVWVYTTMPDWNSDNQYRIKPQPKPDLTRTYHVYWNLKDGTTWWHGSALHNLKLTFDGGTGELKSAEVL